MSKRKTNYQFIQELNLVNKYIIPDEPYINAKTKIACHCAKCGYTWSATPNALLCGSGCARCAGNRKKSNVDFIIELSRINPDIVPIEEYQGRQKPILCRCKKCGKEWTVKPSNLLSKKTKCPQCSRQQKGVERRKTNEAFVRELSLINPEIIPLDTYTASAEKIRCKCRKCGYIWPVTPNNALTKKSGCPKCNHSATSIVEQLIAKAFTLILGEDAIISRDRKAIRKELDVFIPNLKLAIEFGAWFWHKDKLKGDNEKQALCKEKGVHLITILENCPETIDFRLMGDFRTYREKLSAEKDFHTIKGLLASIFVDYELSFLQVDSKWDSLVAEAIKDAQKRDEKEFIRLLHKIHPDIIVREYTRSDEKVHCKCSVCGKEWSPLASSLLSGHGCPQCAATINGKKKRLSNEEFLSRLSIINKDIEPLEAYISSQTPILCKCRICGNTWSAKPANLLFGNGCRKCARAHLASLQSKPIRCVETGVCYNSIAEVTKMGISNVIKCLKGRQTTAGGYHWEYVDK